MKKGIKKRAIPTMLLALFMVVILTPAGMDRVVAGGDYSYGDFLYNIKGDGTIEISSYVGTDAKIVIPQNISGKKVTSIGSGAISCTNITSIELPEGITSISGDAFAGCSSLKSIKLPKSLTSIGPYAFYECVSLADVYYAGTESQWKNITIVDDYNDYILKANIHFTDEASTQTPTTTKLTVPQLTVKLTAVDAVNLSWKKVEGATGYYVYRRIKGEKKYKLIKTVTGTSYTDKKLKKGKTYEYIVDAYNKKSRTKSTTAVSKKIIGKLSTPQQKKIAANSSKKTVTISWKTVKNAQKMEIYRSYNGGKYKKWKTVSAKKGKATYSFDSFKKGTYRFKLKAYYEVDGKKFYSSFSPQEYGIRRN